MHAERLVRAPLDGEGEEIVRRVVAAATVAVLAIAERLAPVDLLALGRVGLAAGPTALVRRQVSGSVARAFHERGSRGAVVRLAATSALRGAEPRYGQSRQREGQTHGQPQRQKGGRSHNKTKERKGL